MESVIVPVENKVMDTLVQVNNGQLVISSRDVANMIGKQHSHLCRDIAGYIEILSKNPKMDSSKFFVKSSYQQAGNGKEVTCYLLTKKGCDMVANKMSGEKGVLFSATYIEKFYEMENQLKPTLPDFSNPAEAARAWANEYEAKQKALAQVAVMKPKAEYFDCLVDRNLLTNFRTTAKELGIKQNQFINWLLENNFVYRDNHNKLMPYSQYDEYFCIKDSKSASNKWAGTQTLITPKGKEAFRLLLGVSKND